MHYCQFRADIEAQYPFRARNPATGERHEYVGGEGKIARFPDYAFVWDGVFKQLTPDVFADYNYVIANLQGWEVTRR